MAINTVVVNPLNTHSQTCAEQFLLGNSMQVKIENNQLSVPVCIKEGMNSLF